MEKYELDKEQLDEDLVQKYGWLVRPCEDYKNELNECTSIKGRFHQYFIYGELLDCSKWNQDLKNCKACLENKKNEACKAIIKNETTRRLKRISGAKGNDVWNKRTEPPDNWNPSLPEFFLARNEKSLFFHKRDEFRKYISTHEPSYRGSLFSCTIL